MTMARSRSSWRQRDFANSTRTIIRAISTSRDGARCSSQPEPLPVENRVHPERRPPPSKEHEEPQSLQRRLRASKRSDLVRIKDTCHHVFPAVAPPPPTSVHVN